MVLRENTKLQRNFPLILSLSTKHPDISLPVAHTCFFSIDIPRYSTFEILYKKLLYAVRFCGEIDTDFTAAQALEI